MARLAAMPHYPRCSPRWASGRSWLRPRGRRSAWATGSTPPPACIDSSINSEFYRDYIWSEVIGRMPDPVAPAHPRTRLIYDHPKFRGYEVVLDVWPGIFASGILLVPKDIKPGERRPVVVCQHGLEGRPSDVADPNSDSHYYHRFAARLAEEGFVTLRASKPVHRRGPVPHHPTEGASAQALAVFFHSGATPAHPGTARRGALCRSEAYRILRIILRRENGGAGSAPARCVCPLDLLR